MKQIVIEDMSADGFGEALPIDQQEDEGDLLGKTISFKDAVVMNADWTIETINSQVSKGNIELDPAFQRRAAWDQVRKSRLIESIVVGMPIPNIVLAENKKARGKYIVIDGKQRLLSVRDFIANKFELSGLDIRPDLNGFTYSKLPDDDRQFFDNSTIRSTVIKNWSDEKFLYATFYRLNSGSLALSPQELRRALVGGNLLEEIENYIVNSDSFHKVISEKLDRRMRDSELVLRFIAFDSSLLTYDGDLRKFLDQITRYFEEDWLNRKAEAMTHFQRLDHALSVSSALFQDTVFKKWTETKYERVINRAVFDCMVRFFAEPKVAEAAVASKDNVIEAYQALCGDPKFKATIERTTKSVEATMTRIDMWGTKLAATLGMSYDDHEKRIH